MEGKNAFSKERILVENTFQLARNFAFYFVFHLRSNNAFPVRLLLSGTVGMDDSDMSRARGQTCTCLSLHYLFAVGSDISILRAPMAAAISPFMSPLNPPKP